MRRTSSAIHTVIPAQPVMGPEVFQAARKTEKEISAIKSGKVQEYYQSMVCFPFLLSFFAFCDHHLKGRLKTGSHA